MSSSVHMKMSHSLPWLRMYYIPTAQQTNFALASTGSCIAVSPNIEFKLYACFTSMWVLAGGLSVEFRGPPW